MYKHHKIIQSSNENLTQYEREGLSQKFNLSDGHAHLHQNASQQKIIAQLPDIFYCAENTAQHELERRFLHSFFRLAHQLAALATLDTCMLCFSASTATEVIAHFLKQKNLKTALIEPAFDNIPAILRRVGVELEPIDETVLYPEPDIDLLSALNINALFIVMPNNPTGNFMDMASFHKLLYFCRQKHILLIADFCFRFFVEQMFWDQYLQAIDSGVDFIFIEDTGKTWSTLELKVGLLSCSKNIYSYLNKIHSDFLLNVSPFTLVLLEKIINDTTKHGIDVSIGNTVLHNRTYLRKTIQNTFLKTTNNKSQISLEWLEIINDYNAKQLIDQLRIDEIYVLPGMHFFWHQRQRGEKYIRVALMRDSDVFTLAIDNLKSILFSQGNKLLL